MISEKRIKRAQELKAQGVNTSQIARTLRISRPSVLKYCDTTQSIKPPREEAHTPFTIDDLFEMDKCEKCKTLYPMPKFLPEWKCPYCNTRYSWIEPCFKP